jgi:hypothetical protein
MRAGIAYQLSSDDPLIDTEQCKLDSALMKKLGANTIRVYHVDPSADHKGCMDTFADAGIYLFVDLDDFPTQIEQVSTFRALEEPIADEDYRTRLIGTPPSSAPSRRFLTSFNNSTILPVSLLVMRS